MARTSATLLAALLASTATGCYDQGDGVEPPLDRIYFPVGLAVSPGQTRLYVVNSDFDLQYNGGTLQAFDLERIREIVPKPCGSDADCSTDQRCDSTKTKENGGHASFWCVDLAGPHAGKPCGPFGDKSAPGKLLYPGRCGPVSTTHPQDGGKTLIVAYVGIGAFATDILYRARPTGPGGRLFIPVRGDATLHYVEAIDEGDAPVPFELECGQSGNDGDCDDAHRRGDDPSEENTRDMRLPAEPFGIAASEDGEAIVVTHQTEGAASLFVNGQDANGEDAWGDGITSFGVGPSLWYVVQGLPQRPIGVAALPEPALVKADDSIHYDPGFLVTFRDAPQVTLLRYFDDAASKPPRPFLQVAGVAAITANSLNYDSRGITLDGSKRDQCETACATGDKDCLSACASVPVAVYIANRTPSTLLVGETRPNQSATSSDDLPRIPESFPTPFGPSRVIVGKVITPSGGLATRVFVICFDSQQIGVYDPESHTIEKWIETGRGPHGFAVDVGNDASGELHAFGYVAHFTDSYLGVVDLDQRHATYGTIVATVGQPSPPRASK